MIVIRRELFQALEAPSDESRLADLHHHRHHHLWRNFLSFREGEEEATHYEKTWQPLIRSIYWQIFS